MRIIKYPGIYRDVKGNFYATMFKSEPIEMGQLEVSFKHMEVYHRLLKDTVVVLSTNDGKHYHYSSEDTHSWVIYKSLFDNEVAYAERVSDFQAPLDKAKYPLCKNRYKFEFVKNTEVEEDVVEEDENIYT